MIDGPAPYERMATTLTIRKSRFTIPPHLRDRLIITLAILGVYRIGYFIPTPGVNTEALALLAEQAAGTMFGLANVFTGGNLSQATIFALGIAPYLSASLIVQLLALFWPHLRRLSKEGELGRQKITRYARYGALVLCVLQSLGLALFLERQTNIVGGLPLVYEGGWSFRLTTVVTMTVGTLFIIWLGDQISKRGIGNGMALIFVAGTVVGLPSAVVATLDQLRTGQMGLIRVILVLAVMFVLIGAVIVIMRGHRLVRVRYVGRTVGPRSYPSTTAHLPLKVNIGGVIPLIFASDIFSVLALGTTALPVGGWGEVISVNLQTGMPLYYLLLAAFVLFFTFFYTAIIFNWDDVAENMRKYGGAIPGVQPGKRTAEYLDTTLMRTTMVWSICLKPPPVFLDTD